MSRLPLLTLLLLLLPTPTPPLPLLPSLPLLLFLRKAGLRWLAALPLPLPLLPGSGGRPSRLPCRSGAEVHHSMRNLHSKHKWISWQCSSYYAFQCGRTGTTALKHQGCFREANAYMMRPFRISTCGPTSLCSHPAMSRAWSAHLVQQPGLRSAAL
jgi:hypothetical protein